MALAREDVRTRISANGLPFPYKQGVRVTLVTLQAFIGVA